MIEKVKPANASGQLHEYLDSVEAPLAKEIQAYWLRKAAELDAGRLAQVYLSTTLSVVDRMQVRQDVAEFLLEVMMPAWMAAYADGGGQDHGWYVQTRVMALQEPWTRDAIEALEMAAGVLVVGHGEGADHEMLTSLYGLTASEAVAVARYDAQVVEKGLARRAVQYARQLLAARAARIARYEPAHARVHGQEELAKRTWGSYGYKKVWRTDPNSNVCGRCAELEGEEKETGSSFSAGVETTPLHPGCRCRIEFTGRTF